MATEWQRTKRIQGAAGEMPTHSFPSPPRESLTRADVVAYLVELQARGWEIYEENGAFSVQITDTEGLEGGER